MPSVDLVNKPPHYRAHGSGVECIDITEHLSFCLGNAIKYLWRADQKGSRTQDLQKAAWYLHREIALIYEAPTDIRRSYPAFLRDTLAKVIRYEPGKTVLADVLAELAGDINQVGVSTLTAMQMRVELEIEQAIKASRKDPFI